MFTIKPGADLSIQKIHDHQANGGSVLRSAHVGNFNPTTLFLAKDQFPIMLHEHLRGDAKIYSPGYIKIHGELIPISQNPKLPLTHDRLLLDHTDPETRGLISSVGNDFLRPAQVHLRTLKRLFPDNVELASRIFTDQGEFVKKILEVIQETHPHLFGNFTDRSGKVFNLSDRKDPKYQIFSNEGDELGIEKNMLAQSAYKYFEETCAALEGGENPEGVGVRSNLYILLSTLSEIYRGRSGTERFDKERVEVIHFSGTEMMSYLIKNPNQAGPNQNEIAEMYEIAVSKFRDQLPREVVFHLVPTDTIGKFVSSNPNKTGALDNVLAENEKLTVVYEERAAMRDKLISDIRKRVPALSKEQVETRVRSLKESIQILPGTAKKTLEETEKLTVDWDKNRKKIIGNMVNLEIATSNTIGSDSTMSDFDEEIKFCKKSIGEAASHVPSSIESEISQYDLISGENVYFPERARNLGQKKLSDLWNFSLSEPRRETEIVKFKKL